MWPKNDLYYVTIVIEPTSITRFLFKSLNPQDLIDIARYSTVDTPLMHHHHVIFYQALKNIYCLPINPNHVSAVSIALEPPIKRDIYAQEKLHGTVTHDTNPLQTLTTTTIKIRSNPTLFYSVSFYYYTIVQLQCIAQSMKIPLVLICDAISPLLYHHHMIHGLNLTTLDITNIETNIIKKPCSCMPTINQQFSVSITEKETAAHIGTLAMMKKIVWK